MTQPEQSDPPRSEAAASLAGPDPSLGWILVLLAGSGCAALIYEIVWLQQLQLVIGSTAVSLGLLLATYMGGLFLGSVAFPQIISARHHPLRIYAALELGMGIFGILILFGLPYVGRFYVDNAARGLPGLALQGMMCAVCLLPPTILMGATFPVVSRWMQPTKTGVSRIGLFYGANIAGAVFGCLFAGFYLLRVHDLLIATYVAVAINLVVAMAGFALATWTRYHRPHDSVSAYHTPGVRGATTVYIATALSGLCALGAQVIWTRLLAVLFGATVYTFSIILAVFLIGLGIGSGIGSLLVRRIERPRLALGVCQMLLAAAIAWASWTIALSLPHWPIDPTLALSPWFIFQVDLLRTLWTILPATLLWGASFPLALAALASPTQDPGRLAGLAYGANTFGAIVGAVVFSLVLIPRIGTLHAQQVLIGLSILAAGTVLGPLGRRSYPTDVYGEPWLGR